MDIVTLTMNNVTGYEIAFGDGVGCNERFMGSRYWIYDDKIRSSWNKKMQENMKLFFVPGLDKPLCSPKCVQKK